VFRLGEALNGVPVSDPPDTFGPPAQKLRRTTHRTIAAVTDALDGFAFNVAVARLYELANAVSDAERNFGFGTAEPGLNWAAREALGTLCCLMSPMMPHLAEEVHTRLQPGDALLVAELPWPEPDPAWLATESVTIAVQVMGKLRGTIAVPPDAPAEQVIAMAEEESNVARALEGRRVVKRIHVPNRIVNFVVAG
jgi:leucyl-tRNA synthetase